MKRLPYLLIFSVIAAGTLGCGTTSEQSLTDPRPLTTPGAKIGVIDVSNDTGELFDVDAIGTLWNALNESLNNKGLLWPGTSRTAPLKLEARIIEFQKGSIWMRCLFPPMGNTVLAVRCNIKEGDQVIATAETKKIFSIGNKGFTLGAWRKAFSSVAEDLVNQIVTST